jgi:hypothetical protein
MPNFLYTAFGLPHFRHRVYALVENLGFRLAFSINEVRAILLLYAFLKGKLNFSSKLFA